MPALVKFSSLVMVLSCHILHFAFVITGGIVFQFYIDQKAQEVVK